MSRRTSIALVLVVALGGGCGTLDNVRCPTVAPPHKPDAQVCRLYGGVRGDWAIISEYPLSRTTMYLDYVCIPLLAAGNLFFDVVGDTVTLPYAAVEEIRRAFKSSDAAAGYAPVVEVPDSVPTAAPTPRPTVETAVGR